MIYAVEFLLSPVGRMSERHLQTSVQDWLSKLCDGYPMSPVELVKQGLDYFTTFNDYFATFNIALPDDADPGALTELIRARASGAMTDIVVWSDTVKIARAERGARPPFKSRHITRRATTPHGGCEAAGRCVEPVPAEERCR